MTINVFFLDDDSTLINSLERYFLKVHMDWETHFFTDQDEAINALSVQKQAVFVVDWTMPGKDGLTCATEAKQNAQKKGYQLHIIMLTGNDEINDVVSALEQVADDYMIKPVDLHELKLHIELGVPKKTTV